MGRVVGTGFAGEDSVRMGVAARLRACVPHFGDVLTLKLCDLGPGQLSLLRSFAKLIAPDIDPRLLDSAETVADILDWLVVRVENRTGFDRSLAPGSGVGPTVRLRTIEPSDTTAIFRATFETTIAHRWRFRGRTVGFAQFEQTLSDGVLAQYVAVTPERPDLAVAIVSAYQADLSNGHVHLAFQNISSLSNKPYRGAAYEAMLLFIDLLFTNFPMRIVYARVPTFNARVMDGLAPSLFEMCGSFPAHYFFGGQYFDDNIYALRREIWEERLAGWWKAGSDGESTEFPPNR